MKSSYQKLVQDTLMFLKEEGHITSKKTLKTHVPPKATALISKQIKEEKGKEPPVRSELKKNQSPVFDLIKKHLPHIQLIEKIPPQQKVAIVVFDQSDLSFLKKIAKAIQERFCPVAILDGEKIELNLSSYRLILAQENKKIKADILLKPATTYKEKEKKELWTAICNHLSPKSS